MGRVLDYLEERPDVDASRVAYIGLSFGAGISASILPYERRFGAAVLYSGGFGKQESQASIDQRRGLAARIRLPLLMLGGRHDFANLRAISSTCSERSGCRPRTSASASTRKQAIGRSR